MSSDSVLGIAVLLPDLLGTYGDRGNAIVLAQRHRWRGHRAQIIDIPAGEPIPTSADLYLLGGGEDTAQTEAVALLHHSSLPATLEAGATLLAICAGFQILGTSITDTNGHTSAGLDLLDATTHPGAHRAIGELLTHAEPTLGLSEPVLTGFENHAGRTTLGPTTHPLAHLQTGTGNGDGTEGATTNHIIATYAHGPVLARNPALADQLLATATATPQPPLPLTDLAALRHATLTAAHTRNTRRRQLTTALTPRRWLTPGIPTHQPQP